jgi:hypothetical protein
MAAQPRIVTLRHNETVSITVNEVAEFLGSTQQNATDAATRGLIIDGTLSYVAAKLVGGETPAVFRGPKTFGSTSTGSGNFFYTLRICDAATYAQVGKGGVGSSMTPAASVVIPSEPAGNTEIILESSTDMVTWTAAQPGIYGSSSTKRFFRVRAQRVP